MKKATFATMKRRIAPAEMPKQHFDSFIQSLCEPNRSNSPAHGINESHK
jgi:hypothetical protein